MTAYRKNDGWVTFKLPAETDRKLREMASATGLKMTTIVVKGIEKAWEKWQEVEGKEGGK
ncbi:MAG: hypothetical protein WCV82_03885 [Candidatus Paceibacterota bacterium]